ncbi:unnamed protein product [Acanthoscelides obtectus]|uniref:Uncharacterized protein n=1 Tax=Acanthoscelides obtectus TaxID=200917 RepID=A0A9P0LUW4_ACAOB|nr:unnamed protein product [Acanthoscelides obtectus]CAK1621448.1 SCAN domain-containing protein 3 [Acanthoscelides obtectus]
MPEKEKDELQLPQCEICMKVLSNDSMRPNCLERHLKQQQLWFEDERIFSSKAESLKRMRLDKSRSYHIDGAPAMIGVRPALDKNLKEKSPTMVSAHCVSHRQALTTKTRPQKLRQTLESAIRIVNYIKSSALNSRLFTLLCEDLDSDHKVLL